MVGVCPKSFAPGNEKLRDPEVPLPRFLLFYPRKTKAKKTSRKEKEKTNKKGGDFKSEGHFVREQVGSPLERVVQLPEHRYAFVLLKESNHRGSAAQSFDPSLQRTSHRHSQARKSRF